MDIINFVRTNPEKTHIITLLFDRIYNNFYSKSSSIYKGYDAIIKLFMITHNSYFDENDTKRDINEKLLLLSIQYQFFPGFVKALLSDRTKTKCPVLHAIEHKNKWALKILSYQYCEYTFIGLDNIKSNYLYKIDDIVKQLFSTMAYRKPWYINKKEYIDLIEKNIPDCLPLSIAMKRHKYNL